MEIDILKEISGPNKSLMRSMILHGMIEAINKNLVEEVLKDAAGGKCLIDVKLTVNGEEINLESFVNYWQKQVNQIIQEKAKSLLEGEFEEAMEFLQNFKETMESRFPSDNN